MKPWIMKQTWQQVLFAHWPIPAEKMEPFIPEPLRLDLFEGQAWISIVPFEIRGSRFRYLPPLPLISHFPELNVRTYVTFGDQPGVYFFSLDAASLPVVFGARIMYRLPYHHAHISMHRSGRLIEFENRRKSSKADFTFRAAYAPVSDPFAAERGSLDYWLTERYCFYTVNGNRVYRCDIRHVPWQLQHAEATIEENGMVHGLELPEQRPLLHYAERTDVDIGLLERLKV